MSIITDQCLCFRLSKVIERPIHNRMSQFLYNQNLLRKGKSTKLYIDHAINEIIQKLHKKELVAGLYFDISNALDMVGHNLLVDEFETYGIRGTEHKFVKCYYLSGRYQIISIHAGR